MLAPGQVVKRALIAAVDAPGPPAAERAACRNPARLKSDGDGGVKGVETPGCKPDVAPVRQKVRKKVHSTHMATPTPIIKIGQEPK